MTRAVSLVSVLLVLGLAWTLKVTPVFPESLPLPQESFDLGRFMGQWYEVAVVSTCPYYMQRKRGNPVILALELHHVAAEGNFTMTSRNSSCEQTSTSYALTNTPGRFFHHIARFGADVDSAVVHTDYDEYAMMLLQGTEKPSGIQTTTVKYYSRTVNVSATALDSFKALARQHGMRDEAVIMNVNIVECLTRPIAIPCLRLKRNVVPPVVSLQEEDDGNV